MSQLFLSNLTLSDFDGKFQLYLSDRALRFTDSGEQNMKIIPRDSVAAVTVRDTDISFSTADIPKAIGCALISAAVSGWLARRSMYGLVHAKGALDGCSVVGALGGGWAGMRMGCWLFRNTHIQDGSFVEVHTPAGAQSFNCSDAQARAFTRLFT
ncbi:unnamed protein product [Symbiodinium pilosum]|uniref:Uncharacterized protein n=1 Tax=Symbiodinium pilosum TaxID=2952 RepID=A0A812UGL0_SYMPI|nr:unnamed protein product [Symbiodinium pilosum]